MKTLLVTMLVIFTLTVGICQHKPRHGTSGGATHKETNSTNGHQNSTSTQGGDKNASPSSSVSNSANKAITLKLNKLGGKVGENSSANKVKSENTQLATQVTLKTADGQKRVIDEVTKDKNGKIQLNEVKASDKAVESYNKSKQKQKDDKIAIEGATVAGKKGETVGLKAGDKIPPTTVNIKNEKIISDNSSKKNNKP